MKTFLTKILTLSGVTLLMLSACKKDETKVVSNGGKPGTLAASTTTPMLDKTKLNDTSAVITFSISKANYGFSAAVTNTLQIDAAGDNWANPTTVVLATNVTTQSYTISQFNTLLLKLNLTGGVAAQVNVRVAHTISGTIAPVYSNVLSVSATPFNLTSFIYVVGAFQGWNASAPDSLISPTSNNIYTGVINFPAGGSQFLILPAKNYANKYATTASASTDPANATYTTEYVSSGGNNFGAPTNAGNYVLTLNITTNTLTIAPVNLYSVIGSVTPGGNYSTDEDFTKYVNDGVTGWTGVFALTSGTFPGGFKIRQNHDWTLSWGTISTPDGSSLTSASGGNIPVPTAGNYKVTFNLTPTAVGVTPPVTATYTLTPQ